MASEETYVCDADCLINLHRHFGRASIRALRVFGKKGALKLPEGIVREIRRGTDKLAKFVRDHERFIAVSVMQNVRFREELARLERQYGEAILFGQQRYGGFWKSQAGRKAADAQVVAVAKVLGANAVSDDGAVQRACALEGVLCVGWSEFARRLGLIKPKQLDLDLES